MWILPALFSALCLGLYDVFKKQSLKGNAVIPVLLINTVICSLLLLPIIIGSATGLITDGSLLYIQNGGWAQHKFVIFKAFLVLSSWICGYYAIKHLPLTIVGPINATRPVLTILGGLFIYGEHLNPWQWAGVIIAVLSFYMLSKSGKKEGIDFKNDKWIGLLIAAAILGACSGLYDKYLITERGLNKYFVQGWYNIYQAIIMAVIWFIIRRPHRKQSPFIWKWSIPMISIFLTIADIAYLYSLSFPDSMISVVSMVRRSSVLVSFGFGALVFHEKNLKGKVADLALVFLSIICLCIGTL